MILRTGKKISMDDYLKEMTPKCLHTLIFMNKTKGIGGVHELVNDIKYESDEEFEKLRDFITENGKRFKVKETQYHQWWQCPCGKLSRLSMEKLRDTETIERKVVYWELETHTRQRCCLSCGRDAETWTLVSGRNAILIETIEEEQRIFFIKRKKCREEQHDLGLDMSDQIQVDVEREDKPIWLIRDTEGSGDRDIYFSVEPPDEKDPHEIVDMFMADERLVKYLIEQPNDIDAVVCCE